MINFATLIFFIRNGNRAQNGESGRSMVAVGQGANLLKQISAMDNSIFKDSRSSVQAFQTISQNSGRFDKCIHYMASGARELINDGKKLAESDKVFRGISKGVKFASDNVNPLIVVSSGINVLTSDDKQSTIIAEGGNLAGMFAMEGWMKKHLDGIVEKLPVSKKWRPIVRGISFVIGSIGASTIGCNIGKVGAAKLKAENEKAQLELSQMHATPAQKQNDTQVAFTPKSLAYKA